MAELYVKAAHRFGFLNRGDAAWALRLAPAEGELRCDCIGWRDQDSVLSGYAIFVHVAQADGTLSIAVRELIALTASARAGLLSYLAGHNNVADIVWDAPVDDLMLSVVREPRAIEPKICVDKMVRVVDITALRLPSHSTVPGLTLAIRDQQAPWNEGTWRMEPGENGDHHFVRCSRLVEDADVVTEAANLGPLVCGFTPVYDAVDAGLVHCPTKDGYERLARLLPRRRAPYCPDTW